MDEDKQNALNLIKKNHTMTRTTAQAILKAADNGKPVMSKNNNVKGWEHNGRFYSNPDFIRDKLTPK